jgi:uncharacterized protein (TIGR00369 family)
MPVPPEEYKRFFEEQVPFNRLLAMHIADVRDGFARVEVPFRDELLGDKSRPALHGGVMATLIDACGAYAVWTCVTPGDRVSTIDLRVDYLAPAGAERLVAEASVVRTGNRVAVVDVRCFQASDPARVVATGKAVYNIKRVED